MNKAYVNFSKGQIGWGPLETMATIQALPTLTYENVEANNPEELQKVISERGAKIVHFCASHMPQRAVTVEKAEADKLYARWFNWKPRQPKQVKQEPAQSDDLPVDIIL